MWIELPGPENPVNTHARHTEILDSCFDLIRSHQQCIPWFPSMEIEPATTELKPHDWANSPYRTQVRPNQQVMVIARPTSLNLSCKLQPYSLQGTWSPPRPRLPKKIRNIYSRNYYDLKGMDIDVYFSFLVEELYCELNYHDQKIRRTLTHDIRKH